MITGMRISSNRATGLYLYHSNGAAFGCTFDNNGVDSTASDKDSIQVFQNAVDDLCWTINGCFDSGVGGTGVSLRSDAESNRLCQTGNYLKSGSSFGITPQVNGAIGA